MNIGDVVEFNTNGCCWRGYGTMLCQIISKDLNDVVRVKILDEKGFNYEDYRSRGFFGYTSTDDTFRCYAGYLHLVESAEAIAIDVQEYL